MNILLTNDDGYNSVGLLLLKEKLSKYGNVIICAPYTHMSAKSVSIILDRGCKLYKIDNNYFAFDGTPADCVAFALTQFDVKIDLVVSGCNNGPNISFDTMYSGTIGACVQAAIMKTKAIAFSQRGDFSIVEKHFDEVWEYINKHNLISDEYILNVNFPWGSEAKDIRIAKQYHQEIHQYYEKDEEGNYYAKRVFLPHTYPKNSETYMMLNDIVSITPLNVNLFSETIYNEVKKK